MSKDKKSAQHSLISRDSRGSGLLSGLVILPSLQDLLGQVEPSSANKSLFLLDISLRDSQNSESLTSENLLQHLSSIKFEGLHSLVLSFRCEAGTDKNKLQILIVKLAKFFHKKKFSNFFFFLHGRIISNRNIESFQQKLINFNEIMTKPTNFTKEESLSQTIANSSLYFSSSPAYKLSIFNDKLEPIEDPDSYVNSIETQTNLDRKRIVEGGNELAMGDVYLEDLITFMSSIDHANVQERTQQLKTKNLSDFLVFSLAYDGIFSNEYLKVLRANGISKEKEVLDALFFNYTKLKQKLAQPVSLHSKDSLQDSPGDLTLPASVRQLLEEKENEKNYMDEFSKIFDHDESNRLMRLYEETVDQSFNQQLFFEKFCSLLHEKYPSLKHSEAMRLSNLFVNHVLSAKQRIIVSSSSLTYIHIHLLTFFFSYSFEIILRNSPPHQSSTLRRSSWESSWTDTKLTSSALSS